MTKNWDLAFAAERRNTLILTIYLLPFWGHIFGNPEPFVGIIPFFLVNFGVGYTQSESFVVIDCNYQLEMFVPWNSYLVIVLTYVF